MSAASLLNAVLQAALASLLLYSGIVKRQRFVEWWQALGQYRVLSARLKAPVSRTVPAIEMALGGCLLLPVFDRIAALAAALLFLLFALAIAANWASGVDRFDCGCQFGARRAHASRILLRAVGLCGLSAALATLPDTGLIGSGLAAATAALAATLLMSWRQLALTAHSS